jgi:diguanylate cyclase (GGDEF)-like protein
MHLPLWAFPGIVLLFGLIFGWYFSSSRLILSLLILSLAQCGLSGFPLGASGQSVAGHTVFALMTFLVPLNLLALSIVREDAMATWRGLFRLSSIGVQPLLVLWLARPGQAELAMAFQQPLVPSLATSWTALPQPALLAFGGTLALLWLRLVVRRNPMDAGTFWAVVATFVAFHGIHYGWSPTHFLSSAGLLLFLTLLQSSYRQTYRDELTGVSGKAAYGEATAALGSRYVIAVVGIDQFKQYSNQYGRAVGEQLLCLVAPKIAAKTGAGRLFRPGGEEFTIIFPGIPSRESIVPLESIRKSIAQAVFLLRGRRLLREGTSPPDGDSRDEVLPVTISIGVAGSVGSHDTPAQVAKSAYRALYEAKAEGGNLVKRDTISTGARKPAFASGGRIVPYSELGASS